MKLLHLSDLHLHKDSADNQEAMEVLELIRQQERFQHHSLVITGDITDDGHAKQYEHAFEALSPFSGRVYVAPGNHDFGAAGLFFDEERGRRFDEMLAVPLNQGGTFLGGNLPVVNVVKEDDLRVMVIALDTNMETATPFDFSCGEVGKKQLEALPGILDNPATSGMVKVLMFHHHPFMKDDPFMEMVDARQLAKAIYGKVDVMLFGHKHVSSCYRGPWGIQWILAADNTPGKNYAREIEILGKDNIQVRNVPIRKGVPAESGPSC